MPPFGYVSALRQSRYRLVNSSRCAIGPIVPLPLREGRGRVGIGVEHRAERLLQRPEMRLVGAPFLRRIAIDRPATCSELGVRTARSVL